MTKNIFFLTFLFLSAALPAGRAAALERAEVPEKYKWNTADLFPDDAAWDKKKEELAARIPRLADYQGKLGLSGRDLFAALEAVMALTQDLSRLQVYASMRSDEDTRVGKTRQMNLAAADLGTKAAAATAFLTPELIAAGKEKIDGFVAAEPGLAPYKPWLADVLRWAPHTLSAPEEKIAAQAGLLTGAAESAHSAFTNADLPYPTVKLADGKEVRLDAQGYTQYRAAADRGDREKVFHAFWSKYKEFETTLGSTLNSLVNTHLFNRDVHKFNSSLEAALFSSDIPVAVYRQLLTDVNENLPTLHRYLKLRQRILGLEKVGYEDLYAPLVKEADLSYTPEQARELVLKAVEPLGPQYSADLKTSYDSRWVDFMPTTGKASGAYSTGVYGVHPYQLQNFTGIYDEVSTLAHESGHSMHSLLSARHQPYITSDYKIFVAEVASTLNEDLLFRYMLARAENRDVKLSLLGSRLDTLRLNLFRQTLFAEFELRMHETAEAGEPLTGERLTALYRGLLKKYYGAAEGVCAVDDLYGIEWAYIPHFYSNFYVYQYATSVMASAMLADGILAESAAGRSTAKKDAYLKLLSAGSSKEPIELLKDAGVDMTTSAPFKAAMREMNGIMDEMEKLL
ncbi:MAG TPA: oligoendopeptidase F [Elusimicrobiales bacterium]|nr:oligoendopeptidase F [Elusimicrobiales bacterium]